MELHRYGKGQTRGLISIGDIVKSIIADQQFIIEQLVSG
jgi:hypothetical protein